jgi:peptide/nickel transport system ATP-binding protein
LRRLLAAAAGPLDGGRLMPLLAVEGATVRFPGTADWLGRPMSFVHALNGVDLALEPGETVGVVGESGCGKSTLAQAIMGLVGLGAGRILIDGQDIGQLDPAALRRTRQRFQVVFQDPQSSLDPRMRAWQLIAEPLAINASLTRSQRRVRAAELAGQVGLRSDQLDRLPHEFSGGQRQRIAIARALALEPDLIVLDEPTSALDVSVQAQILNLLLDLQRKQGLGYLLISHDVAVVRHIADRVAVMYLGQVVESGPAEAVLETPAHPYTRMLLASVPRLDQAAPPPRTGEAIELPSNRRLPEGCYFRARCPFAAAGCEAPQALWPAAGQGHAARCHRLEALPPWRI